jgi:hypothetical protein
MTIEQIRRLYSAKTLRALGIGAVPGLPGCVLSPNQHERSLRR